MRLPELTWPDINALDRERTVVLIPTGAVEQHGPHLPLGTDTFLATAAAEEIAAQIPDIALVTPCLWLGASLHHMPFSGTLSHSFAGYEEALTRTIQSLAEHHFLKFMVINGHGGNVDSNHITLRKLKHQTPVLQLAATNYFDFLDQSILESTLTGPLKAIRHACEAEASLMLHKHPSLVRIEKLRDDGLVAEPVIPGLISNFNEITEEGSVGYATLATAEKGAMLWQSIIENGTKAVSHFSRGYTYMGIVE